MNTDEKIAVLEEFNNKEFELRDQALELNNKITQLRKVKIAYKSGN